MKLALCIWSLVLGHCLAGPFFGGQPGVVASQGFAPPAPISDYTPSAYGSIAVKWWLAARKESFANNDAVGTFTDRSSSAINATQSTGSKQPTFKTAQVNSLPAVQGDGVDDVMTMTSNPASGASAVTVMWVGKMAADPAASAASSANLLGQFGTGANDHMTWIDGVCYLGLFSNSRKTVGNITPNVSQWHLYTIISKSGGWTMRVDGTQVFTTASNTVGIGSNPLLFSSQADAQTYFASGLLAEVVIWNGELTGTDLTTEENGLKTQYGL